MPDLIMIKSGAMGDKDTMPKLNKNELGYCTDKKELYIGTDSGNVRLCGADDMSRITQLINDITARLGALEPNE